VRFKLWTQQQKTDGGSPRHNVTDPDVSATFVLFRPLSDLSRTTTTPTGAGNIDR
jgi:hypothetical protein